MLFCTGINIVDITNSYYRQIALTSGSSQLRDHLGTVLIQNKRPAISVLFKVVK